MLKWSKKNAVGALLAFYQTIEPTPDESELESKHGRGVYIDGQMAYAICGEKELSDAVSIFMANASVADRYLPNAVEGMISDKLLAHKIKHLDGLDNAVSGIVTAIVDAPPEEMRVYMPVYGVDIPSGKVCSVGDFIFVPHDGYDALDITASPFLNIKEKMWEGLPHVAVTVLANDPNKAREKALHEFQWLENAVRLFVDSSFYDFGITSYNFSRVENALVATAGGRLRGVSSHLKGSPHYMGFERIFDSQKILYKVVSAIGKRPETLSPYQRRIRHAIYLGGLSVHEATLSMSHFLGVLALEVLFQVDTDKYVSPSIAQQIVESFCYLVADEKHRRQAFEDMRSFYKKRSAVAHGGTIDLTKEDVLRVRACVRAAVSRFLFDLQLSQVRTPQDLTELIKDMKFGKIDKLC